MHRIRVERDARGIKQHLAPAPTPAARRLSGLPPAPPVDHSLESLQRVATFLRAVTRLSLGALYPGATHEKSTIAIEILVSMLELWPTDRMDRDADTDTDFDPYGRDVMFTPEVSEWLLSLMDAVWTSAREGAMKLVTLLPTPLPGFATPVQLQRILDRIAQLGASPRQREGDAAARLIRTLFRKYVVRLGWTLQVTPELSISAAPLQLLPASASTMVQQLQSLDSVLDKLQLDVQCARADLFTACRTGLAHYSTMMVRTVLSQVAWSASDEAPGGKAAALVQRLTDLLRDALEVSLWALSSPKEVNVRPIKLFFFLPPVNLEVFLGHSTIQWFPLSQIRTSYHTYYLPGPFTRHTPLIHECTPQPSTRSTDPSPGGINIRLDRHGIYGRRRRDAGGPCGGRRRGRRWGR